MIKGNIQRRSKKVGKYDSLGNLVAVYDSMSLAAQANDIKVQNIYKTLKGYKTLLKNHEYRLIENEE
jgi:hypothetical protein